MRFIISFFLSWMLWLSPLSAQDDTAQKVETALKIAEQYVLTAQDDKALKYLAFAYKSNTLLLHINTVLLSTVNIAQKMQKFSANLLIFLKILNTSKTTALSKIKP